MSSRETQTQQMLQPPQPTAALPRKKRQWRSMVCGYLVETDFLESYSEKHGISSESRMNNRFNAMMHISETSDLYWRSVICSARPVDSEPGSSVLCLAIADNTSAERRELPPPECIKKMQEALETSEPPRWHLKC